MGCSTCGKKYYRGAPVPRRASRFRTTAQPKASNNGVKLSETVDVPPPSETQAPEAPKS